MLQANESLSAMKDLAQKQDSRILQLSKRFSFYEPEADSGDPGEWFSEEEDMKDWMQDHENVSRIVDNSTLWFGSKALEVNRELFFRWCASGLWHGSERDSTVLLCTSSDMFSLDLHVSLAPAFVLTPSTQRSVHAFFVCTMSSLTPVRWI